MIDGDDAGEAVEDVSAIFIHFDTDDLAADGGVVGGLGMGDVADADVEGEFVLVGEGDETAEELVVLIEARGGGGVTGDAESSGGQVGKSRLPGAYLGVRGFLKGDGDGRVLGGGGTVVGPSLEFLDMAGAEDDESGDGEIGVDVVLCLVDDAGGEDELVIAFFEGDGALLSGCEFDGDLAVFGDGHGEDEPVGLRGEEVGF